MNNRIVSDKRALIGFGLLAALYVICPIDLMPYMPLDDAIIGPMLLLLAYAKGTSPAIPVDAEQV